MTKRSSEATWLERVLAWRQSDLSAARFCEDQPYHPSSLLTWSSRLGKQGKVKPLARGRRRTAASAAVVFARVVSSSAPPPTAAIIVSAGTSRIEVTKGFDPALLRAVVHALTGGGQ